MRRAIAKACSSAPGLTELKRMRGAFPHSCPVCGLPLAAIRGYLLLRLTEDRLSGDVMKYLGFAAVLWALAALPARAFDIQGEKASLEGGEAHFAAPNPSLTPDLSRGSPLTLRSLGKGDRKCITAHGNGVVM